MILTDDEVKEFHENGVLVLRDFYDYENDIKPIQYDIYKIIGIIIDKYALDIKQEPFSGNNFDTALIDILKINRSYIGEIYDAIKNSVSFSRLASCKRNEQLAEDILDSSFVALSNPGCGIRIDLPNEEKFRAFWHQEYPAQLRSLNGIVFWSPLVKITPSLGPVEVCIGSHKEGPLSVFEDNSNSRTAAYSLRLNEEKRILENYRSLAPLSKPGDLILVDWLTVHQSGYNIDDKARWSMQMRYFDFLEPIGQKISWKGSYAQGIRFQDIHPELLVEKGISI